MQYQATAVRADVEIVERRRRLASATGITGGGTAAGSGRFGEYEVIAPIARGGMGGVYLAAHAGTGERVALKVLDPKLAGHPEIGARLFAEHRLASAARHPGLLEIREARTSSDGLPYLVMEHLEGETLAQVVERGALALGAIAAIGAQVAAALAALHRAGVMHCDVKHENVFLVSGAAGARVKLIDFGVSRAVAEPPPDDSSIAGTPCCMAPEQWQGRPAPASDVYALGCMLYELATGAPPFEGSLPELMAAHLEQRPARPSWLARMPIALERLILRMLAKAPADRPPMAEVARELAALAGAPAAGADAAADLRAAG